jgi:hypothetical protein
MLETKYKNYSIKLINDDSYSYGSADNKIVYNNEFVVGDNITTKHGIIIEKNDREVASIIILADSGATGIHKNCYQIIDHKMLLCVSAYIVCLTLPHLN